MKNRLGQHVRDKVSGFAGIITGKCIYLYKSSEYFIEPKALITGLPVAGQWLSENRLEPFKTEKIGYTKERDGK